MIIEYMLVREMDRKRTPSWVEDGGYFMDPDDNTLVGWSPDQGERDYYIPDSVVELNRAGLIAKVLSIHARYPFNKFEGNKKTVTMTEAEVESLAVTWCENRGEE